LIFTLFLLVRKTLTPPPGHSLSLLVLRKQYFKVLGNGFSVRSELGLRVLLEMSGVKKRCQLLWYVENALTMLANNVSHVCDKGMKAEVWHEERFEIRDW